MLTFGFGAAVAGERGGDALHQAGSAERARRLCGGGGSLTRPRRFGLGQQPHQIARQGARVAIGAARTTRRSRRGGAGARTYHF